MSKFAIECPKCGGISTASTFILARKVIPCAVCGNEIDVKASRLTSKVCPKCGKVFVYDQANNKIRKNGNTNSWMCPACGEKVDGAQSATYRYHMTPVKCPQCMCLVEVDDTKETYDCPVCDYTIHVKTAVAKESLVNSTGISVIQYEGDNNTLVWKHPIENFNSGTVLIVHESQEAVFFLNGQALDLFGADRYVLDTENLPVLKKLTTFPTSGQEPFHAEIYFVNKTVHMGMLWGTDSRIRFIDPQTNIPLDIGASGELSLAVSDSRKLLVKLVGTTGGLNNRDILSETSDQGNVIHRTLQSYFRAPLMTEIKTYLAAVIKELHINIFEVDSYMGVLSEALREKIASRFEEYGLTIPEFYITNIALPEEDPNFRSIRQLLAKTYIGVKTEEVNASVAEAARQRQLIEAQTEAQLKIIRARAEAEAKKAAGFAEAEIMQVKGYTQRDVLAADVQKAYAEGIGNMGSGGSAGGNMAADMLSMFAGIQMAGKMADKMEEGMSQRFFDIPEVKNAGVNMRPEGWDCSCGHRGNIGKFCEECGSPRPIVWDCICGKKGNTGKFCCECGAKRPKSKGDAK